MALQLLAEMLGAARPPGAGGEFWTFAAEAGVAAVAGQEAELGRLHADRGARRRVAVEAFVNWVFRPHGLGTFRALLVALALGFVGRARSGCARAGAGTRSSS